MNKLLAITTSVALLACANVASANENIVSKGFNKGMNTVSKFKPGAVRAEVGTTGYGAAFSYAANPYVDVVVGYNGGEISSLISDVKVNGKEYDVDLDDVQNAYLNAEIRPFANWFHVAVGAAYLEADYDVAVRNASGLKDGTGKANSTLTNISGTVGYDNNIVPYLGVGFSPSITSRLGAFGQVGAYYTGNPTANLSANAGADAAGRDQAKADQKELEEDTKWEWMPVAKVGLTYRF